MTQVAKYMPPMATSAKCASELMRVVSSSLNTGDNLHNQSTFQSTVCLAALAFHNETNNTFARKTKQSSNYF